MVASVKEMKWMILGGEGQLGLTMANQLTKLDVDYISLSRSQVDITNQMDIEDWIIREKPNVVFNAAAWTDVDAAETSTDEARKVNSLGPKLIAEACARFGALTIQLSTDYVFSGNAETPWPENAKPSPISVYGKTKAEGERLTLEANPNGAFIVRTAWLYSPWGKNFVKTMARIAVEETRKIEVVIDQVGQPTSAIDLSTRIHLMITNNLAPGIYHGTNSGQASWFELAQEIFNLIGEDSRRVLPINSTQIQRQAERPLYSVLAYDHWMAQGMLPMQNWKDALKDVLPTILQANETGE